MTGYKSRGWTVMICAGLLAQQGCAGHDVTAPEPRLSWSRVTSGTGHNLWDLWGSSATDVWAVGDFGTILHYQGTRWESALDSVSYFFRGVWGSGPRDGASGYGRAMWGASSSRIWAVERTGTSAPGMGAIWQYDGARWTVAARDTVNLSGIWASSGSDAWVVGDGGTILHGVPIQ
ncbi:MAG TPA: hypothetical protein VI653_04000 [Steroidobacteraceae bacterium]